MLVVNFYLKNVTKLYNRQYVVVFLGDILASLPNYEEIVKLLKKDRDGECRSAR